MASPRPDAPLQELTSISQLLHLTHHRNKNQHRLAKWWKAFSVLRRQVGRLVAEVETLERAVKFSSGASLGEKSRKKGRGKQLEKEEESKYVTGAREAVEERVGFMKEAFSNVIADNQYAALGLMIMATLARVQTLLKSLDKESESESENGDPDLPPSAAKGLDAESVDIARGTDLGEVVSREDVVDMEEDDGVDIKRLKKKKKKRERVEDEGEAESAAGVAATPAKRPKKKRKKGDAFDDLFAGLI
ncbi:uncharacterized protein RCO7_05134 [Rhynchosporium graminicola]|uniref:RNase MRP protein 1 RNA binding domain-containing protein n=1 Tax=Rhynchosporium graminicola TaxID=2792576 RepID=A0A1E1L6G1_9HELO|nr:uncharacterized protein RCO7_05134 [Rhynchosporium commune]